jgi:hypothetical protein
MKDITGREIVRGAMIFYGVRCSTWIEYKFGIVKEVYPNNIVVQGYKKGFTSGWKRNSRLSKLSNKPLIVTYDTIPIEILEDMKGVYNITLLPV